MNLDIAKHMRKEWLKFYSDYSDLIATMHAKKD